MASELEQIVEQMQAMMAQNAEFATQLQAVQAQNTVLGAAAVQHTAEMETIRAAHAVGGHGGGGGGASFVQKWAPDAWNGELATWKDWQVKFRSYMGSLLRGELGRWLAYVDENRLTSAKVMVLGENSRASATQLYGALIATCQGKALVVVQRSGNGEGLEAWRELLAKYEPRSKQSRVMRLCEVLGFNFQHGELLDSLERFEAVVAEYEKEAEKTLDDDLKIGIVIRGIEKGRLREHLLLHSEASSNFVEFRATLDTIARAQSASMLSSQPMDIGAMMNTKFEGTCNKCGKKGHKAADCWAKASGQKGSGKTHDKGKGRGKGAGKTGGAAGKSCLRCGKAGHFKSECRASDETAAKFKAANAGRNVREWLRSTPWGKPSVPSLPLPTPGSVHSKSVDSEKTAGTSQQTGLR
jgi:hypothetical protein